MVSLRCPPSQIFIFRENRAIGCFVVTVYGKSLEHDLKNDSSGEFRNLLVRLCSVSINDFLVFQGSTRHISAWQCNVNVSIGFQGRE